MLGRNPCPYSAFPGNCAYVVYQDYAISGGAQPDFGQSIALDLQIKNVGTVTANNVTATLSTDCDYITLTDATETIPSLDGGATATLAEAFAMDIADNVPNMTKADFTLTCTDGTDTWESKFAIRLYAPEFAVLGTVIDDNDGNGHVDPGETVTAHITVKNAGMSAAPETMLTSSATCPRSPSSRATSRKAPWMLMRSSLPTSSSHSLRQLSWVRPTKSASTSPQAPIPLMVASSSP